mgnify:CR=1 FL=1
MNFTNMLTIPDGAPEMFVGILLIITVTVLIYTLVYIEINKKKEKALRKAKVAAIEGLNKRRLIEKASKEDV